MHKFKPFVNPIRDKWMLHVNPALPEKGMLVVFNPLNEPVTKTLRVNLYYTGLKETARISERGQPATRVPVDRDYNITLNVTIPAQAMDWFVIE